MDNKYDYECAPFITTSTMLGHPRTKKNTRPKSKIQHLRLYQYLLILELVNIFAFICTYFALTKEGELRKYGTDDYMLLAEHSRSWGYGNQSALKPILSNGSWEDTAWQIGIISVTNEWATQHGLPMSATTPDAPGELIYQVDAFHNLHCLHVIQERLLANETKTPDSHTSHCPDYVRRSLMCNVDITLTSLNVNDLFGAEGRYGIHICRDYDAIIRWTQAKRWKGLKQWLDNH